MSSYTAKKVLSYSHAHHNVLVFISSVIVAYVLLQGGLIDGLLHLFGGATALAALVGGFFFTSIFTIGPAGVFLVALAGHAPFWQVVLVGAFGSVIGDILLMSFIERSAAEELAEAFKKNRYAHFFRIGQSRFLRFTWALLGAIIIASPLPDELGLALLGFSRVSTRYFVPISFVMNAVSIFLLIHVALSIS